jgi:hypothetical protein
MPVVKRVVGLPVRFGGEEHSGWLPPGAAWPRPTPIRDLLADVEIESDGTCFFLCYRSQDGSVSGDTWHQTIEDAERAAEECFGVQPSQWRDV